MLSLRGDHRTRWHPPAGAISAGTTLRAWVPAARALPLRTIAAALALAAAPSAVVVFEGGSDLSGPLVAAAVIGATTAAFFVEDPAGETLSASPTPLARRRALRLGAITLGLTVMLAALVTIAELRGSVTGDDLAGRAAEVAAVSALAAAIAGLCHRHGVATAALAGAMAGGLAVLLISSLAQRVHDLPAIGMVPHHDRWWLVAAAGWATAVWSTRDPYR